MSRRDRTGSPSASSMFTILYYVTLSLYGRFQRADIHDIALPHSPFLRRAPMSDSRLAVLILAAGQGTRMKAALPKVRHRIAHRPLTRPVLAAPRPSRPRP